MNNTGGFPLSKSIATRFAVMAVGLVICTAAIVGFLQFRDSRSANIAREAERLDYVIQKATRYLITSIDEVTREVLFLADTPPIQDIARAQSNQGVDTTDGSTLKVWENRLAQIFLSMAEHNANLLQIRLIAADGRELVRINNRNSTVARVPSDKLQDKSGSNYVTKTLTTHPGAVSLFGPELNREYGKIETPHHPVLRAATPIYGANGKVFGLVVININLKSLLDRLAALDDQEHLFYLTNQNGDYLVHPDPTKTFGFDLGERHQIQLDYKTFASFFGPGSTDQLLLFFSPGNLEKLLLSRKDHNDGYLGRLAKIRFDGSNSQHFFVAAAFSPMEHLVAHSRKTRSEIVLITIALALLGAALAIIASRYLVQPLRSLTTAAQELATGTSINNLIVPKERNDEVGALARSFHLMASTLQEKQARFKTIFDTARNPIISIDSRGIIEEVNKATSRLLGYSKEEMLGQNVSMLMPAPLSDQHDAFLARPRNPISKIMSSGREVQARRSDGTTVPVHITVSEVRVKDRTSFTGIMTDLTELKKVDKLKNEFVSTVSHELRTPLTSIKGSLGLLKASVFGDLPPQAKSMVAIAYNNSDRLVRLINDILDIAKIEAGKLSFDFQKTKLTPFLVRAVEANRSYADEFSVAIMLEPAYDDLEVEADPHRLEQVMANLLSNAVKFSPKGGIVVVAAERHGDMVRISVCDHGRGIPNEFRDKIFTKFAQADSSDTRGEGGTGLGLAISRDIVKHHGGTIGFETEEGKGTTFYFELPILEHEITAPPHSDAARPAAVPPSRSGHRVLVCEDDPDMAALLQTIIEEMGHEVSVCATAEAAMAHLAEGTYAAITLDLILPGRDGVSLIRDLRDNPKTRDLPILVVSGSIEANQDTLDGSAFSVVDWMEKPVKLDQLRANLERAIKSSRTEKFRILYIEDDLDHLAILSQLIEPDTAIIDIATTCAEARTTLQRTNYDLVILDLILPDGRGESLLPLIHANDKHPPQVLVFSIKELPEPLAATVNAALVKSKTSNEALRRQIRTLLRSSTPEAPQTESNRPAGPIAS